MAKQLLVFKDTNYAASATNAAVNSATTPDQLEDGAIGIYGIDPILNPNNLSLITDAAASSGSLVNKSDFKGDRLAVYQGTATGIATEVFTTVAVKKGTLLVTTQAHIAGTKGVFYAGYNGTTGSLNLPAVISRGDEGILKINDLSVPQGGTTLDVSYSGFATIDGATGYEILTDMVANIYSSTRTQERVIDADIITNISAGSAFTTSATADVVFGSAAVITSAAHGVGALDYIGLSVDGTIFYTYQAIAVTSTTITLDRPWRGTTQTLVNANTRDDGATAGTEEGIEITDANFNSSIQFALNGIMVSSTPTQSVDPLRSSGRGVDILVLETDIRPSRGQLDNIISYKPQPPVYAVAVTNYDMYSIRTGIDLPNTDHMGRGKVADNELSLAFDESVADSAGKNQSDFEDIIIIFFPDFITAF